MVFTLSPDSLDYGNMLENVLFVCTAAIQSVYTDFHSLKMHCVCLDSKFGIDKKVLC